MTHQWSTASRHLTSEGLVTYQRCPCGRWRTLQDGIPVGAPVRSSREAPIKIR